MPFPPFASYLPFPYPRLRLSTHRTGMSGIEVARSFHFTEEITVDKIMSAEVDCPAGKRAVSGSYELYGSVNHDNAAVIEDEDLLLGFRPEELGQSGRPRRMDVQVRLHRQPDETGVRHPHVLRRLRHERRNVAGTYYARVAFVGRYTDHSPEATKRPIIYFPFPLYHSRVPADTLCLPASLFLHSVSPRRGAAD